MASDSVFSDLQIEGHWIPRDRLPEGEGVLGMRGCLSIASCPPTPPSQWLHWYNRPMNNEGKGQ